MTYEEQTIWNKLQKFQFDDPEVQFKFSDRLARENGWTREYTFRVLEEYRKFLFLCCVAAPATPSDPVDQAWHLHLTFTRSYWDDLCKNTLGKDIHHGPTKGGRKEHVKFNAFYTNTLKAYRDKFGFDAPDDIWHDNDTRFKDINFQRVNVARNWVIPKPKINISSKIKKLVSLVSIFLITLSTVSAHSDKTDNDIFWIWFWIIVAVVVIIIIIAAISSNNKNNRGRGSNGSGGSSSSGCGGGGFFFMGCGGGGDSGCSSSGCSGCGGGGCGGGCGS